MTLEEFFTRFEGLKNERRNEEALTCLREATEQFPNEAPAWLAYATALNSAHKCEQALVAYDRTLVVEPDQVHALDGKAIILCHLGRFEEALAVIDRLTVALPDEPSPWHNR